MEKINKGLKGILLGILILLALLVAMYIIKNFIPEKKDIGILPDTNNGIDSTYNAKEDSSTIAQITISQKRGIPSILQFEYVDDTKINEGSSLTREWIVLNDSECPVQLANSVGINTVYRDRSIRFTPTGNIKASQPITAYQILHVLYDVFGEHIKTLSNVDIKDINGDKSLNDKGSWYATDNQISEYSRCVSFVSKVKTSEGIIWNYNPVAIMTELAKVEIKYKEEYHPSNEKEE
jgi:hypothetical protein